MPNIKSAKKRVLVIEKKNSLNRSVKAEVKTAVKKLNAAIEAGDVKLANELLPVTVSVIDKACTKGVYHKNTASNKKSGLAKRVYALGKAE